MSELPTNATERKAIPLCSGVIDYFPAALVEVAKRSHAGNEQHNAGLPLHWSRGKSADHMDAAVRHILERDLAGAAWRILAALQLDCEAKGAPMARGAREAFGPADAIAYLHAHPCKINFAAYDAHPFNPPSQDDGS
jgi:hypothetical protein